MDDILNRGDLVTFRHPRKSDDFPAPIYIFIGGTDAWPVLLNIRDYDPHEQIRTYDGEYGSKHNHITIPGRRIRKITSDDLTESVIPLITKYKLTCRL